MRSTLLACALLAAAAPASAQAIARAPRMGGPLAQIRAATSEGARQDLISLTLDFFGSLDDNFTIPLGVASIVTLVAMIAG